MDDPDMTTSHLTIGLLHPGEMGASCAARLRENGHDVLWASAGRGTATTRRAEEAGLRDVATVGALVEASDAIVSLCPPAAALDVARQVAGFGGLYLDANAVAPATVRQVAEILAPGGAEVVDGSIVGPPPDVPGKSRLFLSGPRAAEVGGWWTGTYLETVVVGDHLGGASAVKAAYATWTKAGAAMLLAIREVAAAEGVEDALLAEWARSQPTAEARSVQAARSAEAKGWRWVGEMEEIGDLFAATGQPDGFLRAAAEIYRRHPRPAD
jgi:3-hydroxyisobutyrate dehydrogenase-like beta-hydroxyacid dehydrogenase